MTSDAKKAAVLLGKRGGNARRKALSPEQRSAIAKHAVTVREEKRQARKDK